MNQPAPTSAPTEQDRERAQIIVDDWVLENDIGVRIKPQDDLTDRFAAALQAERERTRAETWKEAYILAWSQNSDSNYEQITVEKYRMRLLNALEAAQLQESELPANHRY